MNPPRGPLVRTAPWLLAVVVSALAACALVVRLLYGDLQLYLAVPLWGAIGMAGALVLVLGALMLLAGRLRRLAVARARDEALARARDSHRQFLQRLDHELKNPLTAVRAAAAHARDTAVNVPLAPSGPPPAPGAAGGRPPPPRAAGARPIEVIDAQADRMSRLLADLRRLAELETAPLALETVDLSETLSDAVESVRSERGRQSPAAPIRLDLPAAPWPLPCIRGDGDLLYTAVHNVIANAAKYTPPTGVVEVRGREEAGTVTIEVSDTGIGVPAGELGAVFDDLARASNARGLPGSGLGLPLVRTIVERHGGEVGMTSRQDVGSRVWITLPVAGPQGVAGLRQGGDGRATRAG